MGYMLIRDVGNGCDGRKYLCAVRVWHSFVRELHATLWLLRVGVLSSSKHTILMMDIVWPWYASSISSWFM